MSQHLKSEFPNLVSYNRFIELKKLGLFPLFLFVKGLKKEETGVYFVDSTTLEVCHIKREKANKTFKGLASKSKSTMGWFFGYKLHLIINNLGEIMTFTITTPNTDDRKSVIKLVSKLKGWLFGDKGYLGAEFAQKLKEQRVELFTRVKKNMTPKPITAQQKDILNKRGLVETVIDQLKNVCHIEHTNRSPINALG